ncbi:MAG: GNAT family N-acetyltransferase, partial [Clostridia bacterium]|nr:GNAT family N-acetyltransferase [Clostridia bacterium]
QSAYAPQREYLLIEEFGVEQQSRRRGVGSQLIEAAKQYANSLGLKRIQLDVWAFNDVAEEFTKLLDLIHIENFWRLYCEIRNTVV